MRDRPSTKNNPWQPWHEFNPKEPFSYYCRRPHPLSYRYSDRAGRSLPLLLGSLSKFGHLCLQDRHATDPPFDPFTITALTSLCEGTTSPDHFDVLFADFFSEHNAISKHHVLRMNVLPESDSALQHSELLKIMEEQHIIFYEHLHANNWAILFAHISTHHADVQGYFIGDVLPRDLDPIVHRLTKFLKRPGRSSCPISWTRRLHVSGNFHPDRTFLVFEILHSLQHDHMYLDISAATLFHAKFRLKKLLQFLEHHDHWLGQMKIEKLNHSTIPFIVEEVTEDDNLGELSTLGWKVQDVSGDGNCGFYAMLLGLPNIDIHDFDLTNRNYKKRLLQLRLCLQHHSMKMLKTIYPRGSRDLLLPRWTLTGEYTDKDIDGLSAPLAPFLNHKDYFTSRFKDDHDNHMNPGWAPHVLASRFRIRVIVYYVVESNKGRSWSIVSFEYASERHISEEDPHVKVHQEPIGTIGDLRARRISDLEFKRIPTIELLYQTGFTEDCPQHFQYLQRITCAGVQEPPAASETTIGEFLTKQQSIHQSIESTKTSGNVAGDLMEVDSRDDSDGASTVRVAVPSTGAQGQALDLGQLDFQQRLRRPLFTSIPPLIFKASTQDLVHAQGQDQPSIQLGIKPSIPTSVSIAGTHLIAQDQVQRRSTQGTNRLIPTSVSIAGTHLIAQDQVQRSTTQGTKRPIPTSVQVTKKPATNSIREARAMKYDSKKNYYYVFVPGDSAAYDVIVDPNRLNRYDQSLIEASTRNPDIWVGASITSATGLGLGIGDAPVELWTEVISRYQRLHQPNCPYYPMANALFYADYEREAEEMFHAAATIASTEFERQIGELLSFLQSRLPIIGSPTIYNVKLSSGIRKKRPFSWDQLFLERTEFPTLVIPKLVDETRGHPFCVIDDLIFDSSTPRALKLCMASVRWICKEPEPKLDSAYRFNTKYSPPGTPKKYKTKGKYKHQRRDHWEHE